APPGRQGRGRGGRERYGEPYVGGHVPRAGGRAGGGVMSSALPFPSPRAHASRACPTCALIIADLGQARDRCAWRGGVRGGGENARGRRGPPPPPPPPRRFAGGGEQTRMRAGRARAS